MLQGTGPTSKVPANAPVYSTDEDGKTHSHVQEEEFADVNGINYSLDDLIGATGSTQTDSRKNKDIDMSDTMVKNGEEVDASVDSADQDHAGMGEQAAVAMSVGPKAMPWTYRGVPKPGNKMFFAVVYLGPGDYHR